MKKTIILILAVLMICGCLSGCQKSTIVPEFTGHDVKEVYEWCAEIDAKYSCEVSYAEGNGVARDQVIEQSVKGGSRLDSDVSFKISNGATSEITPLHVDETTDKSDVENWRANAGIKSLTYIDEYSDTVEKNCIIRIEPTGTITKDTPVTVYVSLGQKQEEKKPVSSEIEIVFGDFIGLTVEQFEAKARELGLRPNHNKDRDRFNPDVAFGNISWHGSGVYVKDEIFNYGVCINAIEIIGGQYIGKSESEFLSIARKLTLSPKHIYGRDAYSTRIDAGDIVTHGYGTYEKGEEFKYGLSLGPAKVISGYEGSSEEAFLNYIQGMGLTGSRSVAKSSTVKEGRVISYNTGNYSKGDSVSYVISGGYDTYITVPSFKGLSEDSLVSYLKDNGMKIGKKTYESSLVPTGYIVYNDTGVRLKGSRIDYVVSNGPIEPKGYLDSFRDMRDVLSDYDLGYSGSRSNVEAYLRSRGFNDYEIWPEYNEKYSEGALLYVIVGGERHAEAYNYSTNSHVIVSISANINGN